MCCDDNSINEGLNGYNVFTLTTAIFTIPAKGSTGTIYVSGTRPYTGIWARPGSTIFVNGNYFTVISCTETSIEILNPETDTDYTTNQEPGELIPLNSYVVPSGIQGPPITLPRRSIILNTSDWDIPPGTVQAESSSYTTIAEGLITNLEQDGDVLDFYISMQPSGSWTGGGYQLVLNGVKIHEIIDNLTGSLIHKLQIQRKSSTTISLISEISVANAVATPNSNATTLNSSFTFVRTTSQVNISNTASMNLEVLVNAGSAIGVAFQYFTAKFTPYDN